MIEILQFLMILVIVIPRTVVSWLGSKPIAESLPAGALLGVCRSKQELIMENSLLPQQLVVLRRQVNRLQLTKADRALLVLLAGRLRTWKSTLFVVQPSTLLRWHRAGFRLFWKRKSRTASRKPRLPADQRFREATPFGEAPRFLVRDNDSKYAEEFAHVAEASGIEVLRTPYKAPKANAMRQRFVGSVRRECTYQVLLLGERQLYQVIKEYVGYNNYARPHQGIGQGIPEAARLPVQEALPDAAGRDRAETWIISIPVLGGLHHDYRRVALVAV